MRTSRWRGVMARLHFSPHATRRQLLHIGAGIQVYLGSLPQQGSQYTPQNMMSLIVVSLQRSPTFVGNPHVGNKNTHTYVHSSTTSPESQTRDPQINPYAPQPKPLVSRNASEVSMGSWQQLAFFLRHALTWRTGSRI